MFSALFSFLGGSVFRMLWGEVTAYLNKKQDHVHEIERMRLQADLDDKAHQRTQDNLRLQHRLGVRMVEVQKEAAASAAADESFGAAIREAFKPTGIAMVDAWNGIIRPQFAQIALCLWFAKVVGQGFTMDDYDKELVAAILGFFVADRSLLKRGK
jgi:hypothetical protein